MKPLSFLNKKATTLFTFLTLKLILLSSLDSEGTYLHLLFAQGERFSIDRFSIDKTLIILFQ